MIAQGLSLMIIGMGTVFCFLAILVGMLVLKSFIITRYFPEAPEPPAELAVIRKDKDIVAAIAVAVKQFCVTN
ncbi:OadG family protein [Thermoproteota archaeon]